MCSKCNHPLFSSRSKFAHSSPWPAFTETIREDSVTKMMETLTAYKVRVTTKQSVHCSNKNHNYSHQRFVHSGVVCTQVLCGKCGNGLGHEFVNDGPEEGISRF